jgi:ComF family protein
VKVRENSLTTKSTTARYVLQSGVALLRSAGDLVFPPMCMLCHEPIAAPSTTASFCDACRGRIARDRHSRCGRCCSVVPEHSTCLNCATTSKPPFAGAVCLGAYQNDLRDAILRAKNPNEIPLAAALAEKLYEHSSITMSAWRIDRVVGMPMHWMRRLTRGVNGPQIVAERLAWRLGVREERLLVRGRNTPPQASLPHSTRPANVRGAFRARRPGRIKAARILLVDDVMTTGATSREAASTLLKAGAAAVFVAVLAHADT